MNDVLFKHARKTPTTWRAQQRVCVLKAAHCEQVEAIYTDHHVVTIDTIQVPHKRAPQVCLMERGKSVMASVNAGMVMGGRKHSLAIC
jgi:hypothetical protein